MHALFRSAPVSIGDGAIIIATGVALMGILEVEKTLMRRFGALRPAEI